MSFFPYYELGLKSANQPILTLFTIETIIRIINPLFFRFNIKKEEAYHIAFSIIIIQNDVARPWNAPIQI